LADKWRSEKCIPICLESLSAYADAHRLAELASFFIWKWKKGYGSQIDPHLSLTLLDSFLSSHSRSIAKPLIKFHKHKRKFRMDAPLLTSLLEETNGLQSEAQKSQAAKIRATD
jgi:hypothetical protein